MENPDCQFGNHFFPPENLFFAVRAPVKKVGLNVNYITNKGLLSLENLPYAGDRKPATEGCLVA
jgi:hypothetical protein